MTRETKIEKELRLAVEAAGGRCIKLPAILYRGIPDRLVVLPGARVYFVELKTETGRVSIHQKRWRSFLLKLGFNCTIISGISDLRRFVRVELQGQV